MLLGIRWRSMRAKIIAWSFVPTAIILIAVAWVTVTAYQQVTEELVIERNQELTRLSAGEFAAGLTEHTVLLTEYSGLYADPTSAAHIHENDLQAQRDALRQARGRLEVFDGGVLVLDNQGTVVAAEPGRPEALGQNWSDRGYFRQMLRSQKPTFSDVVADGPGDADVVVVAVPITGPQGQFLGLLAGMFRLGETTANPFWTEITKLGGGKSGSAYWVDGTGRVIYHSNAERIGDDLSEQQVVQRVSRGEVGALRTRDVEGQDIVASYSPVPGTDWGFVTEESWAVLISPSQRYRHFLLLLLVLGILVPALVVAVGVRRITKPIAELIQVAQDVAGGNFGQTITARTGDEIEELAEQFNAMSAQLAESYARLERRLADRTTELATLNTIAASVSSSPELETVLDDALHKTLQVINVEAGGIYLLEDEAETLRLAAQRGFSPDLISEIERLPVGEGFSGRVVQSGRPLVVRDIAADHRLTKMAVREDGLRSLTSVPLHSKGKVMGALFAATHGYREFTDQDVQLLTSIGHQVGVAIENAQLLRAERRQRQEATLLAEMAKLISGTLDLDEVLRLTAEYAVDVFDVHCCCIFLLDEGTRTLRPAAQIGHDDPANVLNKIEFIPSETLVQTVFDSLQPLIVEDVHSNPHLDPRGFLDLQSALVVPIEVGGRRLGAMQLGTQPPRRRRFSADEGDLALAMANQAAVAIDSARLFKAEQRRAEQFKVISEVGRRIVSIVAVDELLEEMAWLIQETFDLRHVGFGLIEGDEVVSKAQVGPCSDVYEPLRFKVGHEGTWGRVAGSGEPLLVPDVRQDARYRVSPQVDGVRSQVCVPLKTQEALIGVLSADSDQLNAFDESDLAVLQSLANQAAVAIEKARFYEQAQRLAVLEERSRLARDLHDAVTQTLFSASLISEALPALWETDQDEGRQLLKELRQLSRGALAEMRTLLLELRPAALAEACLGDLLRQLAEAVTGRTGIPVEVAAESQRTCPSDVHVALYRIAQEALNNVVKHAQATRVVVTLSCELDPGDTEGARLSVTDNGRGFDPENVPPDRLGLGIIHERARAIGATLAIDSQPGHGTQITVAWGSADQQSGTPKSDV